MTRITSRDEYVRMLELQIGNYVKTVCVKCVIRKAGLRKKAKHVGILEHSYSSEYICEHLGGMFGMDSVQKAM